MPPRQTDFRRVTIPGLNFHKHSFCAGPIRANLNPMVHPLPRASVLLATLTCALSAVFAAERTVDLRYGMPTWHQPLGIPGDWHKPMANERGALL